MIAQADLNQAPVVDLALPSYDLDQVPIADLIFRSYERSIATVTWRSNSLHAFGVDGGDDRLYHKQWKNSSNIYDGTIWVDLGGNLTGAPSVVAHESGNLTVFGRHNNRRLWYKYYNGEQWFPSTSGWISLGGDYISSVAAVSSDPTTLHTFGTGQDLAIYHGTIPANFQNIVWENLGGIFPNKPAAAAWGPDRLAVFGTGVDNSIWWKVRNGTAWSSWTSLGGSFVTSPSAVAEPSGRLAVFGINQDGNLLTKYFENGVWSTQWTDLQGSLSTTIAVQIRSNFGTKRYDIFAVDKDLVLSQKTWNGNSWLPWIKHFKWAITAPGVTSRGDDLLDVFVLNTDRHLVHHALSDDSISEGVVVGYGFLDF